MRTLFTWLIAAVLVGAVSGCTSEGVGDPCEPESCPTDEDDPSLCAWNEKEVYLEHFSLQCRTRVCMVYRYNPAFKPYCTRPCGPGAATKGCPKGYECAEVTTGATEGAGCYCVDKDQLSLNPAQTPNDLDIVAACD
jgi:hypothetical protein